MACLEGFALVPRGATNVLCFVPEMVIKLSHDLPHAVALRKLEALLPVHGIKCFFQANKHHIEGDLFNMGNLLSQLGLNHGHARPTEAACRLSCRALVLSL